jgi:hypothetical protein
VIDEHAAAVLALLNAAITTPRKVFDGKVDANTDPSVNPYILVYFDSNDPEFDKEANAWRFELTATCHCVGGNAQAARQMADLARTALTAVRPTVTGRSCFPITREPGTPPQRDESTGVLVMDQIDQYVLRSLPG